MSGAGAGNGIGSAGLPPELPQSGMAGQPQQWNDAVRIAVELQADFVTTATVALELNAPATFGVAFLRPGVVPEAMAMEGVDRQPVGLTDPTPSIDRMAPVDPTIEAPDVGQADLRSSGAPSVALPQQLAAVLQAAGYNGSVSASAEVATATPPGPGTGGDSAMPAVATRPIMGAPEPATDAAPVASRIAEPGQIVTASAPTAGPAATLAGVSGSSMQSASLGAKVVSAPPVSPATAAASLVVAVKGVSGSAVQNASLAAQVVSAPPVPPATAAASPVVAFEGVSGSSMQSASLAAQVVSAPPVSPATAAAGPGVSVEGASGISTQSVSLTAQVVSAPPVPPVAAAASPVVAFEGVSGNATQGRFPAANAALAPTIPPAPAAVGLVVTSDGASNAPMQSGVSVAATALAAPAPPALAAAGLDGQAVAGLTLPFVAVTPVSQPPLSTANSRGATIESKGLAGASRIGAAAIGREPIRTAEASIKETSPPLADRGIAFPAAPPTAAQAAPGLPITAVPGVERPGTNFGSPPAAFPLGRSEVVAGRPDPAPRPLTSGAAGGLIPAAYVAGSREPLLVLAPSGQAPGLAPAVLSRHGDDAKNGDRQVMSYAERRMVPIDIAPMSAEVPTWRLDDTQTFVTVGSAGARSAALRAADLYRGLMDRRANLEAMEPGDGFVTWEGSPLWLSLAAIHKPPGLGVLPAASAPGRVQVMRTEDGEWLVEHAGGPWRTPRALRHHAMAGDDEALLLDVLYGVSSAAPETAALRRFEGARTALLFAGRASEPAAWRAHEAWAMVARCCAIAAGQSDRDLPPPADAALARAMQAALSAVVDGLDPEGAADPLAVVPLSRDRFVAIALTGDPNRLVAGLRGLGRSALDRVRRGRIDEIDPPEAVALAVCLGRLTHQTFLMSQHLAQDRRGFRWKRR